MSWTRRQRPLLLLLHLTQPINDSFVVVVVVVIRFLFFVCVSCSFLGGIDVWEALRCHGHDDYHHHYYY